MATQERSQRPQNSYGIRRRSLACPQVVSISNSTLKGQPHGMHGKCRCLRCGQPMSVDLDHRVSELVARADRQLLSVCNTTLCQHLGMAREEGAYSRDKMSDPAYKPLLRFRLGRICGTLRYMIWMLSLGQSDKSPQKRYCGETRATDSPSFLN